MLKRELYTLALVATLMILGTTPEPVRSQEPTGKEIMTKEDNRPDGDDRKSIMTMTLINKQGSQRVRQVESFSKDYGEDKKSVMVFKEPADVRGTAFLSWEYDDPKRDDDKWLYMPALKKERRISGASKNEYFMGTDFTYDDMGDRNAEEDNHTLLGQETVLGHDCWKIESIPVDPEDMYTRKVVWVDKEAYLILQAEYYDKDGLLKIYKAVDVRKQDGFWTTFRSEMDNVSRGHKTVMEIASIRYDSGMEDDLFKVSSIQRGRIP
jgi:outer membrane lipoprotein-sorting protein